jgi:adenosylcobinamide kinase/adenosylcobinamide-phosphate guanylyltransferase
MKTLILGGVRSGKSRLAEEMAANRGTSVSYLATAEAGDVEMRERIDAHQTRRPTNWINIEEPIHLARALQQQASSASCVLIDCLSLWVTNLLLSEDSGCVEREIDALLDRLPHCPGELIMVSTESNLGVVPMGELSRRYCDRLGLLHQQVASQCDRVILTVAGLPHYLKGAPD